MQAVELLPTTKEEKEAFGTLNLLHNRKELGRNSFANFLAPPCSATRHPRKGTPWWTGPLAGQL